MKQQTISRITRILTSQLQLICRYILSYLPKPLNVLVGRLGFTRIIKRAASISFVRPCFNTDKVIHVCSSYAVERESASKTAYFLDPCHGIRQIGVKNYKCIDIGANIGAYSLLFAALGAKHVYAIEPGPLYDRLRSNIDLNNLQSTISTFKVGLSDEAGSLLWAEDLNNPGNAHLIQNHAELNTSNFPTRLGTIDQMIKVNVETLDKLALDHNIIDIDLIKVDVEGMESKVIAGGLNLIRGSYPTIVAETHASVPDMYGYDCITPLFSSLYELGYKTFRLNDRSRLVPFLYPNIGTDTFFIHRSRLACLDQYE